MHPDWPYYGAPREIVKILEKVYGYSGESSYRIFEKWVRLCHLALDALPGIVHHVAQGGAMLDFQDSEEWEKEAQGVRPEVMSLYAQALGFLLEATHTQTSAMTQPHHTPFRELSYADCVGQVFQYFGVSKSHQKYGGIFFTPWSVAYMMAQMSLMGIEQELKQRFVRALECDPATNALANAIGMVCLAFAQSDDEEMQAAAHEAFYTKMLPMAKRSPDWEPVRIVDPAVGSGVMLLAAAKSVPRYAIDLGLVEFYGIDICPLCVEMCRLNMRLYGMEPLGISPVDLLTVAQIRAVAPEPLATYYENAKEDVAPGRDHWVEQVNEYRAEQLPLW